jgi:RNA polymerase sigma factor (sigma-70 family)
MQNNEKSDFDGIYEEYYKKVYRNILYLTGDAQAAEDLAQETFIKLYKNPPCHSNIIGWLTKVSANLSFNYLRSRRTRTAREVDAVQDDEIVSIEESAIKNCEIKMIRKVLDLLPDRDRMCLLLKFSGYKYDEIARIINVNKSSIGTMLARSQVKFKEVYLKECGRAGL